MNKFGNVSGTGTVSVDGAAVGHCAYDISVYKDRSGKILGRGQMMGESDVIAKISHGQRVIIAADDDHPEIAVVPGEWHPGDRTISVETGGGFQPNHP